MQRNGSHKKFRVNFRAVAVLVPIIAGLIWLLSVAIDWSLFFESSFEKNLIEKTKLFRQYCDNSDSAKVSTEPVRGPFVVLWNVPRYDRAFHRGEPAEKDQSDIRNWQFRRSVRKDEIHKVIPQEADPNSWESINSIVCVKGGPERFFNKQVCAASKGMILLPSYEPSLVSWDVRIVTFPKGTAAGDARIWPEEPECVKPDAEYVPEQVLIEVLRQVYQISSPVD